MLRSEFLKQLQGGLDLIVITKDSRCEKEVHVRS